MINISIVLYHAPYIQVQLLIDSLTVNPHLNKIYLIDNSETETTDYKGDHIHYIFVGKNIGFGAGHNLVMRESLKDQITYYLVINYDLKIGENIINWLIQKMEEDKSIGIIMPKALGKNYTVQLSGKFLPNPFYVLFSVFKSFRKIHEDYSMKNYLDMTWNQPIITGCFNLFRVSALSEISLYDDRVFMYFEDDDPSKRIHRKYKTVYFPERTIEHSHQKGASSIFKLFIILETFTIRYFNKYGWIFDQKKCRINKNIFLIAKTKINGETPAIPGN
jgi:GT2 family glycosyltransferase